MYNVHYRFIFSHAVCNTLGGGGDGSNGGLTPQQQQCITDASIDQAVGITTDCAGTNLNDVCIIIMELLNFIISFLHSCQVSATAGLASPAFQPFTIIAILMD